MEDTTKRLIETFEKDFHELSAKGAWTSEDLEKMKNLQKLMYYLEVRCAMKEGGEYPGSEYIENNRNRSYDNYNNSYRGGMNGGRGRGSYDNMPYYNNGTSGHYNYPMNMSGRRYYDNEPDKFMGELHRRMETTQDPMLRDAMKNVADMLEMR